MDREGFTGQRLLDEGCEGAAPVARSLVRAVEHVQPNDGQVLGGQVELEGFLPPPLRQAVDGRRSAELRFLGDRVLAVIPVDL